MNKEEFVKFILNNRYRLEKRKYFNIKEDLTNYRKEPCFAPELYYLGNVELAIKELEDTYIAKEMKFTRNSCIEIELLKNRFWRALFNNDRASIRLGYELINKDRNIFFDLIYKMALLSEDVNKLIKVYFLELMLKDISDKEIIKALLLNTIGYFISSEQRYIKGEIEVDELYAYIYEKNKKRYTKLINREINYKIKKGMSEAKEGIFKVIKK